MGCEDDTDSNKVRDSTEFNPPPLPKIHVEKTDTDAMVLPGFCPAGDRLLRYGKLSDPEYVRQRQVFDDQFEDTEGFDVDWDSFDYKFFAFKFEWAGDLDDKRSNKEMLTLLIDTAIEDHNDEYDTKLEFVDYVSANVMPCQGYMYYITFWAKDLSSPNPEPKIYQAKVRKFFDEILVRMVRPRPTEE